VDTPLPRPPHLSDAYGDLGLKKGAFPFSEEIADTELSLPIGPHMSLEDANYVVELIHPFVPD